MSNLPDNLPPSGPQNDSLLPAQPADCGDHAQPNRRQRSRRRRRDGIPTRFDALRGLGRLPLLIATGALRPADANAIRGAYAEILRHSDSNQVGQTRSGLSTTDLKQLLKDNPQLFEALEPLLRDDEIDELFADDEKTHEPS